jgi:drug/metabolite transporter (DMT)-like permease
MLWFVLSLLSAIFVSISTILQKKILMKEHALEFSTVRILYTFLFSLTIIPFIKFQVSLSLLTFIYIISLGITAGILYRAKAVRHLEISVVSPLMNISPLFLVVIAYFILKETPTISQFVGIILILTGAYFLEADHKLYNLIYPFKKMLRSKHIHYLIFALLVFAFTATFEKFMITHLIEPLTLLFFVWFFVAINFVVLEIARFGLKDIKKEFKRHKFITVITSFFTFLGTVFYILSLSLANVSLVIPIRRLSTLFTTIVGGELFHENRLKYKIIACFIITIGAYLIYI